MFGGKIAINVVQSGGEKVPLPALFAYFRLYVFHKVESVLQPMPAFELFFLVSPPQNSQIIALSFNRRMFPSPLSSLL